MKIFMKLIFLLALMLSNSFAIAKVEFSSTISDIPKSWQQQMVGHSWNPGCPVPLNQLAYLKLSYWGYDQKTHSGVLIIHKLVATEVVKIFKELYNHHFPINEMKPYEMYPTGEYAKRNDTVGFYCRPAQDNPSEWSSHSYGVAIDINPLVNPYYDFIAKQAWPIEGKSYLNRNLTMTGMIQPGNVAFNAFTSYGWIWGGFWKKGTDYMHFRKEITNHYMIQRMIYRPSNTNPKLPNHEL
jgi:hypothetical protein